MNLEDCDHKWSFRGLELRSGRSKGREESLRVVWNTIRIRKQKVYLSSVEGCEVY